MAKSRISLNIHAQFVQDTPRLKAHLQAVQPASVLVMDGLGLAQELKALLPDCIVINRIYPDDDIHNRKSPTDWMNERAPQAAGGIWQYTTNEAGFSPNLIQWHIELCHLAIQRNVPLVIANCSVGTPAPEDWAAGRELFELMNTRRDLFILGLHEYWCAVVTSGFLGGAPNHAGVPIGETGGVNLIPSSAWPDPTPIPMYHCGRFTTLVDYCNSVGIQPPRIILTEHGFDDVSDIKAWSETLIQTPPYTSIRGWRSCEEQLKAWYGAQGWSSQRAYFEMLKYADQTIYKDSPVEAQLIFCWARPDNSNWEQFDVSDARELQDLLEAYTSDETEQPPTDPPDTGDGGDGEEPPVTTGKIDLLPYFEGDGRMFDVNHNQAMGGGWEVFYTEQMPQDARFFRQIKNRNYESFAGWSSAAGKFIMRDLDTSPGNNECYRLRDKDLSGWSRWCPQLMAVGEWYTRSPIVTFINKTTGQPVPGKTYEDKTRITLVAHHPTFKVPVSGLTYQDVVELAGYPIDSNVIGETYYFCRHYGLIAWKDNRGHESGITYDPSPSTKPIPDEMGAWANPPALPADVPVTQPPNPQPPQAPAKPSNAANPVTLGVPATYKLRSAPDTSAEPPIGKLKTGETITAYRAPETNNDGEIWHYIERAVTPANEAPAGYSAVPLPPPTEPEPEPPTDDATLILVRDHLVSVSHTLTGLAADLMDDAALLDALITQSKETKES